MVYCAPAHDEIIFQLGALRKAEQHRDGNKQNVEVHSIWRECHGGSKVMFTGTGQNSVLHTILLLSKLERKNWAHLSRTFVGQLCRIAWIELVVCLSLPLLRGLLGGDNTKRCSIVLLLLLTWTKGEHSLRKKKVGWTQSQLKPHGDASLKHFRWK